VLESWADVAIEAVWDTKQRVAKVHVCRRGSRAIEDAERIAAEAEIAGLIVAGNWCGWYNLGNVKQQQWLQSGRFRPRSGSELRKRQGISVDRTAGLAMEAPEG